MSTTEIWTTSRSPTSTRIGVMTPREPCASYGAAVSMAFRQPMPDLPDDMLRLLASLN